MDCRPILTHSMVYVYMASVSLSFALVGQTPVHLDTQSVSLCCNPPGYNLAALVLK